MKNIFIIGSKGIPAKYGGFETFVEKLTFYKKNKNIKYHVSCLSNDDSEFEYNDARCFSVHALNIGSARALLYDMQSLKKVYKYVKDNNLENVIIYILGCRIGPYLALYKRKLNKIGIKVYVNPDGHEWLRSKWNRIIKAYWKYSEKLMTKYADMLICDSKEIEKYIKIKYKNYQPNTVYIPYGADISFDKTTDENSLLLEWFHEHNIKRNNYYLIVGRFVPENNYEVIIKDYMSSKTNKDLVIITNVEKNAFYNKLLNKTNFNTDKRIKFVGTVYNQNLLRKIREQAFAYIHGHEVGGTNPSLLEALANTELNIVLDVKFNREVAQDGALYFSKTKGSLISAINNAEKLSISEIGSLHKKAIDRILNNYTWDKIIDDYEELWG